MSFLPQLKLNIYGDDWPLKRIEMIVEMEMKTVIFRENWKVKKMKVKMLTYIRKRKKKGKRIRMRMQMKEKIYLEE